ncbi:hypothetical protein J2Z45_004257 [Cohnella lubricantis]|uniref:hypothetical protein n=1 Tax=Cohnella lubricantis TaxID=2163172 RepID=UPI001AEA8BF7|nr:hypothetical protein [Cohnella lubricantis]MBP2120637.1 hypothetical protein [Cohnella lubricantis]
MRSIWSTSSARLRGDSPHEVDLVDLFGAIAGDSPQEVDLFDLFGARGGFPP